MPTKNHSELNCSYLSKIKNHPLSHLNSGFFISNTCILQVIKSLMQIRNFTCFQDGIICKQLADLSPHGPAPGPVTGKITRLLNVGNQRQGSLRPVCPCISVFRYGEPRGLVLPERRFGAVEKDGITECVSNGAVQGEA